MYNGVTQDLDDLKSVEAKLKEVHKEMFTEDFILAHKRYFDSDFSNLAKSAVVELLFGQMGSHLCSAHYNRHHGTFSKAYAKISSHRCIVQTALPTKASCDEFLRWLHSDEEDHELATLKLSQERFMILQREQVNAQTRTQRII